MYFKSLIHFLAVTLLAVTAHAAEWQWSVPVPPKQDRAYEKPRAYLWIPPQCARVRGVVFGQHNMEEQPILEHPAFRKTLEALGFAEVWVAPGFDAFFRFDQGAGEKFDTMMKDLADVSGYTELTTAPIVPVGHSAAASLPWYFAAWKPERTLACISFSGQWPYVPDEKNAPQMAGLTIDSVPGLVTAGEYEWADESMGRGLKIRSDHPQMPLSGMGCPADGHFEATDEKVEFLALYLRKAVQYRLPKDPTAPLVPIDATKTGWLADSYGKNKTPSAPPAPVGQYKGDPAKAFWWFDQEIANAANAFQQQHRGKPALLGYVQNGQLIPQTVGTHPQVIMKFLPADDGVTFKLSGTFLDTVPDGRPTRWTDKKAGEAIEKPRGGPAIEIRRITGPIRKISDDTWVLALDRSSYLGDRRSNEAWLAAIWPGNATYKRAIQQSVLQIPGQINEGTPQQITFNHLPNVTASAGPVKLKAKSDAKLPVGFYVREGPAEMDGDMLRLTQVPPRGKWPVKITVVAWQLGRAAEPKIQSAQPVEQSFLVTK